MNALRFAPTLTAILTATAVLSSSCSAPIATDCAIPSPSETAADGGPDPCHCDPPPSLNLPACPCLSGTPGDVDVYDACLATYRDEMDQMMDAGAD